MRKLIYFFTLIFLMCITFSCKEDYLLYDSQDINKLYFDQEEVEFIYGPRPDLEEDISLKIHLIGFANLGQDAEIKVIPDEERSTAKYGIHYTFTEEPRISKDSTVAYVRLNFLRESLVKDMIYTIHLHIGSNEDYIPTNTSKCLIKFGDTDVPQPTWWQPDRLGTYTLEKYMMFIELYHKSEEEYPEIYKNIEKDWGRYLDQTTSFRHMWLLTTAAYLGYFKKKMYVPMYEYFLKTGNEAYRIPDPMDPSNNY